MKRLQQLSPRTVFLTVFSGCAILIGAALVMQHFKGISPCPLCILQRYGFVLCGLIALVAALHNPAGAGRRFYGVALFLAALGGGGVSARQSWLQHNPPPMFGCGPGLDYMVDAFPLADLLPMIFRGEGDCSKVDWSFLGFSLAEWALVCFVFIAGIALWQTLRQPVRA